nr:protein pitchfork isoform X1 [Manis javanica]
MCFRKAEMEPVNIPFGTCQQRKLFPHFHPPNFLGNKFLPLRGVPHRGPGCYIADDKYGLAYNLSKIPTSRRGYAFGARTALRFTPINKVNSGGMCIGFCVTCLAACICMESKGQRDMMPSPGMYQTVNPQDQKHKQNFAPFNASLPRFRTYSKDSYHPGPGTYNPETKLAQKISWPMKFGSPDWAQVPCVQKRTLKVELSTDKEFRKHRNRVAYLHLFYN